DEQPPHHPALRAGLVRDQRLAEELLRCRARARLVLHQLDAARLAPPAGVDLRLHHAREAELARGRDRLVDREAGLALRDSDAVGPRALFARALGDVHAEARRRPVAPTSSCTCEAETSSAFFSSAVSAISIPFSTPPAPICTGTPT